MSNIINYVPGIFYGTLEIKLFQDDTVEKLNVLQLDTLIGKILYVIQRIFCFRQQMEIFRKDTTGFKLAPTLAVSRHKLDKLLFKEAAKLHMIPENEWIKSVIDGWKGVGKEKTMYDWDKYPFIDDLVKNTFFKD